MFCDEEMRRLNVESFKTKFRRMKIDFKFETYKTYKFQIVLNLRTFYNLNKNVQN